MESKDALARIISSLSTEDKSIVSSLHETALALGYVAKISPVGKKPDDWKSEGCENIQLIYKGVYL
ncbi:MAG: hypothetical protein APF77_21870 [Clostridia bacterium BRH_c25]|nr:MAG: hypothetical protein APF77_21870 [Clostridia bacterium BRH_c25]